MEWSKTCRFGPVLLATRHGSPRVSFGRVASLVAVDREARSAPRMIVGMRVRHARSMRSPDRKSAGDSTFGAVHKGTGSNHVLHPSAEARILVL